MAHFCALGLEIPRIVWISLRFDRKLFDNVETVSFESDHFFRIVREETDLADAEVNQNLGTGAVFTEVHRKSQFFIGFDGVEALFLEFVSANFGRQSDSSSFLAHINQHAGAGIVNVLQCSVQLIAAIAAARTESIPGQTLAVDTYKCWLVCGNRSLDERQMMDVIDQGAIKM